MGNYNSNNRNYRVKADLGSNEKFININLTQDFDYLNILSLKLKQEDLYKIYTSNYGILVGRVIANNGFGVPNAKISIFIQNPNILNDGSLEQILYPYTSVTSQNDEGIRYNLLPSEKIDECHQNIGTFPNKRMVLDNNVMLEVYENYYKFTTVSNEAGDYMIFGLPVGQHQLHVDIDLSDVGILSQKPRDMVYNGYNIKQFESSSMFKKDVNLDSLAQIVTENTSVYIYPFWGDENENEVAITRNDIKLQYKFQPTAIFMGSIFSDTIDNTIHTNCKSSQLLGKMDTLVSSEGTIEMIRKTFDNRIEYHEIEGNRLIDGNGVWCYQIPMNMDYVVTDEYGNLIPSEDPNKGIPTRTSVRFRISIDNTNDTFQSKKKASYLVPNNPKSKLELDYEFGESTRDSSFVDMFWNKVYSVKNYIPRYQMKRNIKKRYFLGLKTINSYGQNNPLPYNNLFFRQPIIFKILCVVTTFVIEVTRILNQLVSGWNTFIDALCQLSDLRIPIIDLKIFGFLSPFCKLYMNCTTFESWCGSENDFAPGCTKKNPKQGSLLTSETAIEDEMTCFKNELAQETGVFNFDFYNDWINGSLYAPSFALKKRKKKKKRFFGIFGSKIVGYYEEFCGNKSEGSDKSYTKMKLLQGCAPSTSVNITQSKIEISDGCGSKCYDEYQSTDINTGIIVKYQNPDDSFSYYYKPSTFIYPISKYILNTDIILLGSLNNCDIDGIPPLHQMLPSSSFNEVPWLAITDSDEAEESNTHIDTTGADWGLKGYDQCQYNDDKNNKHKNEDGGLFLRIDCLTTTSKVKSCVNASRICELGVSLDSVYTRQRKCQDQTILPDGFVSQDELIDSEARQMFATLNGGSKSLKTIVDPNTGFQKYTFQNFYPENFDGRIAKQMRTRQNDEGSCSTKYGNSANREYLDLDYYNFRFGFNKNEKEKYNYYTSENFPRYENSFYFYFGIKPGSTAIDKFNSTYYAPCINPLKSPFDVKITVNEGYTVCSCLLPQNTPCPKVTIEVGELTLPYTIIIFPKDSETPIYDEKINNFAKVEIEKNGSNECYFNNYGVYKLTITDANQKVYRTNIEIPKDGVVSVDIITTQLKGDTSEFDKQTDTNENCASFKCGNFFGTQFPDELALKGVITLFNFEEIIANKGCTISNYEVEITRTWSKLVGEEIKEFICIQTKKLSEWVNKRLISSASGSIPEKNYYDIYVCDGNYQIKLVNINCPEDNYTTELTMEKKKPLEFIVNDINIEAFIGTNDEKYWSDLYKALNNDINGSYTTLLKYPIDYENNKKGFNEKVLNAFTVYCSNEGGNITLTTNGGGTPTYNFYLCGKGDGEGVYPTPIIIDNIQALSKIDPIGVNNTKIYQIRGVVNNDNIVKNGDYIVYGGTIFYNNVERLEGERFTGINGVTTYFGSGKVYLYNYINISNGSITHKEYYTNKDGKWVSYNKHIWVQPSTLTNSNQEAPYLTSFDNFNGEYQQQVVIEIAADNTIPPTYQVETILSGDNGRVEFEKIPPRGVQVTTSTLFSDSLGCGVTNRGYYTAVVDNNGTGMVLPKTMNTIILPMTLDTFESQKSKAFYFPIFDKRLMWDEKWSKTNSNQNNSILVIGDDSSYKNPSVFYAFLNGILNITETITNTDLSKDYFIRNTSKSTLPMLRAYGNKGENVKLLDIPSNTYSLNIQSSNDSFTPGSNCSLEITLPLSSTINVPFSNNILNFNITNDNKGTMTLQLSLPDVEGALQGTDNIFLYLVNCGNTYTSSSPYFIKNIKKNYYNKWIDGTCPTMPRNKCIVNGLNNELTLIETPKIPTTLNTNNRLNISPYVYQVNSGSIWYSIFIDYQGVRTFSTPIDFAHQPKFKGELNNSQTSVTLKTSFLDSLYINQKFKLKIQKWVWNDNNHTSGSYVPIDDNNNNNWDGNELPFPNEDLSTYRLEVTDVTGLVNYKYLFFAKPLIKDWTCHIDPNTNLPNGNYDVHVFLENTSDGLPLIDSNGNVLNKIKTENDITKTQLQSKYPGIDVGDLGQCP